MSNNKNNENSNVVEIVYMTTQPKTDLPTHVTVRSTGRISTVLCEQVYSVSTERVGTYIGECTDKEMENIDIALMISLQLDGNMKTSKKYNETIKEQQEEIDSLKKEIEMLQQEHEDTIAEIEQDAAVYVEENKKIANMEKTEDTIRLQTERDTYKTMYEQLLKISWYNASVMLSYMGLFKHTDTYNYYIDYIKPKINVKKLKRIVSKHSRKENEHDRLEKGDRNTAGQAGGGRQDIVAVNGLPA